MRRGSEIECFHFIRTIRDYRLASGINTVGTTFVGKVASAECESIDGVGALCEGGVIESPIGGGVGGEGEEYSVSVMAICAVCSEVGWVGTLLSCGKGKGYEYTRKEQK
ncbi:hypothetical protein Vadar_011305 [Vaccinium darrowii]|uniref:Uncharacterized protein n=1 Tax=Vaccinium darrowii TaxID=229202 RepID=A0ACB7YV05_9ERIC|nr:hypothetical protein Vadar_011305 [Vaccinium darrowii]